MRPMIHPLAGALLQRISWPGRSKLLALLQPETVQRDSLGELSQIPGVEYQMRPLATSATGWYIPLNLLHAGEYGSVLTDYVPEPRDIAPSGRKLLRHQARAVTFIRQVTPEMEGCILGAAAGCGKTTSVLQSAMLDGYFRQPVLVIGTNTSRAAWCGDDADPWKHYGLCVTPLFGEKPDQAWLAQCLACTAADHWFFIHYDILPHWQPILFSMLRPTLVIVDESQHLAHARSRQSLAAMAIVRSAATLRRVLLSGTPIPNKRPNLWHQLAVAQPRQWGWYSAQFETRYCGMYLGGANEQGDEIRLYDEERVLPVHMRELQSRLAGVLLRYEKEQAEGSVPALRVHQHRIGIDDPAVAELYNSAVRDTPEFLRRQGTSPGETITVKLGNTEVRLTKNDLAPGATKLVCLNILIGILSEYKAKQSVQLVLDLWRKSGYVVAFTWRRDGAKALADGLFASHAVLDMTAPLVYGPMDGAMKQSDRQKLAQQFAETGGIMVATMGAAGESINELAVAPVGVAVDLHWQPATVIQMVSRLQRMNSPHQSIDMHFVVCKNTLDEQLVAQLVDKIMSASATVPGETAGNYLVDLAPDRSIQPLDIDALFAAFAADIRED